MKIYYRGYVIDEEFRFSGYTVYGRRPERTEIANHVDAQKAMKWIDGDVTRGLVNSQGWQKDQPSLV